MLALKAFVRGILKITSKFQSHVYITFLLLLDGHPYFKKTYMLHKPAQHGQLSGNILHIHVRRRFILFQFNSYKIKMQ